MPTHLNLRWQEMEEAMAGAAKLQNLALYHGVPDIFSDNGGKVVQVAVAVGLDIIPGRTGADAKDRVGNLYEMKTLDLDRNVRGFSTNHHLNMGTIAKYRGRRFVFATYNTTVLQEAYMVTPEDMEPIYQKWERMLKGRDHLNNPKIPLDYVRDVGVVMYLKDVLPEWMEGKTPLADLQDA